ncbi:hypothetical protein [Rhizobium sp. RCC_161_2]|uniref:hypothetical protein n=1 Tax=Rhizobium sp. RCC_161_2 TaxID=3239219 RepID=UPI0035247AB7
MLMRGAGLLVLGLFLAVSAQFQPVRAQGNSIEPVGRIDHPTSTVGAEYASQCLGNGLRCTLVYADTAKAVETAPTVTSSPERPSFSPRDPIVTGPLGIVVVLVGLVAIIGLWMRFGNGGVLLSPAPREMKQRQGETPENWHSPTPEAQERPNDFLQRIAAMADRRQALVLLLRHCLLHAADVTGTRLFRSDTERAVLGRLPAGMPGRDRLENLLNEAELVHYGGRVLAESQFTALLATARGLLSSGRLANA